MRIGDERLGDHCPQNGTVPGKGQCYNVSLSTHCSPVRSSRTRFLELWASCFHLWAAAQSAHGHLNQYRFPKMHWSHTGPWSRLGWQPPEPLEASVVAHWACRLRSAAVLLRWGRPGSPSCCLALSEFRGSFTGGAGAAVAAGQPHPGGLWECQDREE